MLTNNLDFKRAIAQQFDPETNYSQFDEAEVDGAFEATVYQLLLERGVKTPPTPSVDFGSIIHQVIKWNGLDIGLEYRPGEVRFPGRRNSRKLRSGYGHIRNHIGADGEALDCYLAPAFFNDDETPTNLIFQISQISPEDGDFDEYKFLLGYKSLDEAKVAYLREMPSDYFGGIREVAISDLDQYRKTQSVDLSEIKAELVDIKRELSKPTNFSESVLTSILTQSFQPYLQRLDELADKVDNLSARFAEFSSPIEIQGDVLSEDEFEAIATVDEGAINEAIADWEKNAPEKYKELI